MHRPARAVSSWIVSAGFHAVVLALLLLAAAVLSPPPILLPPHVLHVPLDIRVPAPQLKPQESGGGQSQPGPVKKGTVPQARPRRAFVTPLVASREQPTLAVEVAWNGPADVAATAGDFGDPLGLANFGGGGGGLNGGFGDGDGGGIGNGSKPGFSGGSTVIKLTRLPRILLQVEPEYTEQARRAHVQGFVKLRIEVGPDGVPVNIRVVEGIGLGLDENAIAAVKRWRFAPALVGDKPVTAPALVEVGFHLL